MTPDITSILTLRKRKQSSKKFSVLTCYDAPTARILFEAGIDVLLVGDSYGQVVLGLESTLSVTMDMMVTVSAAVRRGAPKAFIIGDMPYLSYQINNDQAVANAGRLLVEGGCNCIKVEVDRRLADVVRAISRASVPVMAHLGLRPQSIQELGGYRVQAKVAASAMELIEDARIMEEAGAAALLLEGVPPEPARIIAENTLLPVIGCGAGPHCDGHVLVLHDLLGWTGGRSPRFAKQYTNVRTVIAEAAKAYATEIAEGTYPASEHCYPMEPDQAQRLESLLKQTGYRKDP